MLSGTSPPLSLPNLLALYSYLWVKGDLPAAVTPLIALVLLCLCLQGTGAPGVGLVLDSDGGKWDSLSLHQLWADEEDLGGLAERNCTLCCQHSCCPEMSLTPHAAWLLSNLCLWVAEVGKDNGRSGKGGKDGREKDARLGMEGKGGDAK